ncbi:MAG: hypothetical protein R6V05_01950 [Candidatus Brocadiia bacterium]
MNEVISHALRALSAAAAEPVEPERLTGLSRWVLSLYDEHRFLYALLAVGLLLGAGAVLGIVIERLLMFVGMGTEELDHAE